MKGRAQSGLDFFSRMFDSELGPPENALDEARYAQVAKAITSWNEAFEIRTFAHARMEATESAA